MHSSLLRCLTVAFLCRVGLIVEEVATQLDLYGNSEKANVLYKTKF